MPIRTFFCGIALSCAWALPAVANGEFYLVRDKSTERCAIVEFPPVTTALTLLADGRLYSTRGEAERALKNLQACAGRNMGALSATRERVR